MKVPGQVSRCVVPVGAPQDMTASKWSYFPARERSHVSTIRARSALVNSRYPTKQQHELQKQQLQQPHNDEQMSASRPVSSMSTQRSQTGEAFKFAGHRYPLTPQRPASADVPKALVERLSQKQTIASRAKTARGRYANHVDGYSWITLNFYTDAQRSIYDKHGGMKGFRGGKRK